MLLGSEWEPVEVKSGCLCPLQWPRLASPCGQESQLRAEYTRYTHQSTEWPLPMPFLCPVFSLYYSSFPTPCPLEEVITLLYLLTIQFHLHFTWYCQYPLIFFISRAFSEPFNFQDTFFKVSTCIFTAVIQCISFLHLFLNLPSELISSFTNNYLF